MTPPTAFRDCDTSEPDAAPFSDWVDAEKDPTGADYAILREIALPCDVEFTLWSARQQPPTGAALELEDFLEPLTDSWNEDCYVVAKTIEHELAEFDADH